jgi:hypothetical protein
MKAEPELHLRGGGFVGDWLVQARFISITISLES